MLLDAISALKFGAKIRVGCGITKDKGCFGAGIEDNRALNLCPDFVQFFLFFPVPLHQSGPLGD